MDIVAKALYASKITSYAQGLNIIKAKSDEKGWNVDLGEISRIWKVFKCISMLLLSFCSSEVSNSAQARSFPQLGLHACLYRPAVPQHPDLLVSVKLTLLAYAIFLLFHMTSDIQAMFFLPGLLMG